MSQENVEIVVRALNATRAHDRSEVDELFERDAEWHNTSVFPGERTWRGPAGIIAFWDVLAEDFEEAGLEIEDSRESGDGVVVGIHSWGQGKGSGAPVDVRWAAVFRFHGRRIARVDVHSSYPKALEAVSQENVEVVRRVYDGWSKGDFGAEHLADVFDPEVRIEWLEAPGIEDHSVGVEAYDTVRPFLSSFDKVTLRAERVVGAGHKVATVSVWRGQGKTSGAFTEWRFGNLWTFRDGKVVSIESFSDPAEALEALGAVGQSE